MSEITFGTAGVGDLLSQARESVATAGGCEEIYDQARCRALHLVRADRPDCEVKTLAEASSRIAALALATSEEESGRVELDPQLKLALRLEVLGDLMRDQSMWRLYHGPEAVFELPYMRNALKLIASKGPMSMLELMNELRTKRLLVATGVVRVLSDLRYVTWDQAAANGHPAADVTEIMVSATEEGKRRVDEVSSFWIIILMAFAAVILIIALNWIPAG